MSIESLKFLRENYPRRPTLRAEEVAHVLGKKITRGTLQRVREKMKNKTYPGAQKVEGLWQLPVEVVAEIMDPTPNPQPQLPQSSGAAPSRSGRRKSQIGPRLEFMRTALFWVDTLRIMGLPDEAQELLDEVLEMRAQGSLARDVARSNEQAAALHATTPEPSNPTKSGPWRP